MGASRGDGDVRLTRFDKFATVVIALMIAVVFIFAILGLGLLGTMGGCAAMTPAETEITPSEASAHKDTNENRGTVVKSRTRSFRVQTPMAAAAPMPAAGDGGGETGEGSEGVPPAPAPGPVIHIRIVPPAGGQKGGT